MRESASEQAHLLGGNGVLEMKGKRAEQRNSLPLAQPETFPDCSS